ncbi:hypothetical protein D9757_010671 [Collybiopsis confluens]|uniref:Uncharacterized protein n=1 Tax=Collybiopsis confluens TaxID=2823264 RepID=A0A8H5GMZ2_9AGAR|nr:hypothetical protein D9757_010671 [Collybiopsis confluens]
MSCECEDHVQTDIEASTKEDAGNAEDLGGKGNSSIDINGVGLRKEKRKCRKEECDWNRENEVEDNVVDEDIDIDVYIHKFTVDLDLLINRPRCLRTKEIQKDGRDGFGVGGVEVDSEGEHDIPLEPRILPPKDDDDEPPAGYQHPFLYPFPAGYFSSSDPDNARSLSSSICLLNPYECPPLCWIPPSVGNTSSARFGKRKESSKLMVKAAASIRSVNNKNVRINAKSYQVCRT